MKVLHINGLAESELLSLCTSPARLICRLYEHWSIFDRVQHCRVDSASHPDIHSAVEQIAAVNQVDIKKIRLTLLDKWLPSRVARQQQESADVTMNVEVDGESDTGAMTTEDECDLMRAVYLLERCSPSSHDDAPVYLIRFALEGSDDVCSTPLCQVRAIRCLLALTDLENVEKLSNHTDWHQHLSGLLYMSELRRLRVMPTSDMPFDGIDKSSLARAVCRSRDQNAGLVAACLAVDFCNADEQLWTGVFARLTLDNVAITRHASSWRGRHIAKTLSSFISKSLGQESLNTSAAFDVMSLCQKIPAPVDSTSLFNWALKFYTLNLPGCSASCGLMSSADCIQQVTALLASKKDEILQEIEKCRIRGQIFTLSSAIQKEISQLEMSGSFNDSDISACSDNEN